MKKFTNSIIYAALLFFSTQIYAQAQKGNNQGQMPMDGKVTGIIIDGSSNQPVEYASVALYRMKDSTLITGVISNSTGAFTIDNTPYGKFYIDVTFVGFKKQRVKGITVIPTQKTANVGTVKIDASSTSIKEVEVIGTQAPVQYKIDKKVVDVSQNVVAAGGNVVDALQNTPSVQTDVEGNVTVRGSGNFTVLIDGKPSVIQGSEALQQIPASLVQNIEIITNPSAKYDAEGSAGIINVIMKKQKIRGMNGAINLTGGTGDKYSGNINVNYKNNKFNYSLGADFSNMKFSANSSGYNISPVNDTIRKITATKTEDANGDGNFKRSGYGIKGGIEYTINDNSSISISGTIGKRANQRTFSAHNTDYFSNPIYSNTVYFSNINSGKNQRTYKNLNLDYQLKLSDKGHQLSVSAYYAAGPETNTSNLDQDTTTSLWVPIDLTHHIHQTTKQVGDESELRTKIDYSLPLWENGKLEAGYQGKYSQNIGKQYISSAIDLPESLIDNIDFTDNIQEGYITLSNTSKIADFMVGLRGSYENRNFTQKMLNKSSIVNRFDVFPSIHLSRQLPWDLQIQANFTQRINRPRDWNLDPLEIKTGPLSIRKGKPDLQPEFSNAYELNLQKKLSDASFVSAEGFIRSTKNLIQNTTSYDTITGKTISSFDNIDHDRSMGVEFMLNWALAKWVNFNASSSIYDYHMFGNNLSGSSNNSTNWNLRVNPTFRIPKGPSIQFNYQYNGPSISSQGTRAGNYNTSLGIRQEILNRKGSLTLQVRSLFGQEKYSGTTQTANYYSYNTFKREARTVMLTFNYRINNYKAQQNKRTSEETNGNGGDQDMGAGGM